MGLFNRNKKNEPSRETRSTTDPLSGFIQIPRADGSVIGIRQQTDKMGYPLYEQIAGKVIPKFSIIAPELQQYSARGALTKVQTILIDFPDINDVQKLNDPYYMSQVANILLNANRMQKIMKEYHGYAGGLNLDSNGNVVGKFVDANVINQLKMDKSSRDALYAKTQAEAQAARTAAAAKQGHEQYIQNYTPGKEPEKLDPSMLNPNGSSHRIYTGEDR